MVSAPAVPSPSRVGTFGGDLWGGLAAALVALPSSVAFGVAVYAPLGPDWVAAGIRAGIFGAIILGLVAPLLGGTPRLISAPSASVAAVLGAFTLSGYPGAATPEAVVAALTLVALLAAGFQLLYGSLGGGKLIKYIPYPVASGYLSAVGLLIVLSQLPKFFGWPAGRTLVAGLCAPGDWQWQSLVVGGTTVGAVLLAPRLTRAIPATILGLAAGGAAYAALGLAWPGLRELDHNPLVLGRVAGGFSAALDGLRGQGAVLTALPFPALGRLVVPALTLSVLLSIDTLKTCVNVDVLTRTRHQSNRELLGQGAANLLASLAGGLPGSGTTGPTLINLQSGGATRRSGVVEGLGVLLVFLVCGRWLGWLPVSALAGILLVIAARMIDWHSVPLLRQRATLLDFGVIAMVVAVAVGRSLIAAAGAGVALAILLFIREQVRGTVIRRRITGDRISSKQHRLPAEQALLERLGAQITVCELQGSLFFGTTDKLFTELEADLKHCRFLILDMRRVHSVDFTAAHVLEQFAARLRERAGVLLFSRLPATLPTGRNLQAYFAEVGLTHPAQNGRLFDTLDDALRWAEDQLLAEAQVRATGPEAPLALAEIELLRELQADQLLAALAPCVTERTCGTGEPVFQAGEPGDELYLIRRGNVRIVLPVGAGDHHNLASFGRGDFFGEVAFLDRGIRSANAVATEPTDLYVLSRRRFDDLSRAHALVGLKVFARLARALALRLRRTDAELRTLYES